MMVRELLATDIERLKEIHSKFYEGEFDEFPDFLSDKYICTFVVTDDNGSIITAGGIRIISECVILTDKDYPVRIRKNALCNIYQAFVYVARKVGIDRLYASTWNSKWAKQLEKAGFKPHGHNLVVDM